MDADHVPSRRKPHLSLAAEQTSHASCSWSLIRAGQWDAFMADLDHKLDELNIPVAEPAEVVAIEPEHLRRHHLGLRLHVEDVMERIGTLETVCRYPVKSMAGEEIEEAFVGFSGLMGDRAFAFVREPGPSGFPWLTGREQGDLILYRPRFIDAAAAALPRNVEKSFGMAPGVFAAYPEPAAFAVSVTTPGGQTWPVDSAELKAELEQKSGQKVRLRFSDRSHWDCRPVSCSATPRPSRSARSSASRRIGGASAPTSTPTGTAGRPSARTSWSAERWQWATGCGSRFSSATRAAR
jgi:MOSC N-terminal beta barrel domain